MTWFVHSIQPSMRVTTSRLPTTRVKEAAYYRISEPCRNLLIIVVDRLALVSGSDETAADGSQ